MIMQLMQHQIIAINMQYTFKQLSQCVHDYPSRIHAECIAFYINNPVKLVTGNHVNLCIQLVYLYTLTQSYKFKRSVCGYTVHVSQQTMHNASPCCVRVRMPCLIGFFSNLYSNVVINISARLLFP